MTIEMDKFSRFFPSIPASTVHAARALYGRGNVYLRLGDRLNHLASKFDPGATSICISEDKAALLALLTIVQYNEKLTDDELAKSIQLRMDLRYALHLATPSPSFDPRSFCKFRGRILTDPGYHNLFEEMFKHVYPEITSTTINEGTDIDDVVNSICENEIRASLLEAMFHSIEVLSANHFDWLRGIALPHWYQRYNRSLLTTNSEASMPVREPTQEELEGDIRYLIQEIRESNSRDIMEVLEIRNIMSIWEKLQDSQSRRNCRHCVNKIH